jgi:hypothetical protein
MTKMICLAGALGALLGAGAVTVAVAAQDSQSAPATISVVQGSILVSRDNHIVPGEVGMELRPLNRVFVLEDSQATVTFRDGCEQQLPSNAMLTVTESGTCEAALEVEREALGLADGMGTSTQGSFAAAAAAPAKVSPLFAAGAAGGSTALLVGGGVVAAGGLIALIANDDDNGRTFVATSGGGGGSTPPISPQ